MDIREFNSYEDQPNVAIPFARAFLDDPESLGMEVKIVAYGDSLFPRMLIRSLEVQTCLTFSSPFVC